MNRETYRETFDSLPFSADFEARTLARLETEQEESMRKTRHWRKTALLAAALAAVLAVSVSAAVGLLSPREVAEHLRGEDPLLAEALAGGEALNEAVTSGPYTVTLLGLASGDGLSAAAAEFNGTVVEDRTYAVFSVESADGTPLENQPEELSYTPLVAGYDPAEVNAWTLGAEIQSFLEDGTAYYLLDTRNLEPFADHTVYLAVYAGGVPDGTLFTLGEDGAIAFNQGVEGTAALFTLPLDPARADPAAAEALVESLVFEG